LSEKRFVVKWIVWCFYW